MICYACKENRMEKSLAYCAEDLKTYCINPVACKGTHPATLGKQMVNQDGLLNILKTRYPKEMAATVEKYAKRPIVARLKPSQLLFLLRYQHVRGTASLNETIITALTELQLLLDDVMNADIDRIHVNWSVKPINGGKQEPPVGLKPEPEPEPEPLMPEPKKIETEPEPIEEEDNGFVFEV